MCTDLYTCVVLKCGHFYDVYRSVYMFIYVYISVYMFLYVYMFFICTHVSACVRSFVGFCWCYYDSKPDSIWLFEGNLISFVWILDKICLYSVRVLRFLKIQLRSPTSLNVNLPGVCRPWPAMIRMTGWNAQSCCRFTPIHYFVILHVWCMCPFVVSFARSSKAWRPYSLCFYWRIPTLTSSEGKVC